MLCIWKFYLFILFYGQPFSIISLYITAVNDYTGFSYLESLLLFDIILIKLFDPTKCGTSFIGESKIRL